MDGHKCYMFKVLDINQSHGNWMARTGGTRKRARPKREGSRAGHTLIRLADIWEEVSDTVGAQARLGTPGGVPRQETGLQLLEPEALSAGRQRTIMSAVMRNGNLLFWG